MKNYNTFLFEKKLWKGTSVIDDEFQLKDILLEHCKEFDPNKPYIQRNVYSVFKKDETYLIDPKLHKRKSANTKNYYTQILDTSEKWKEFPKRSSSIICRLEKNEKLYSETFYVIPFDNSKWGVCPSVDMWWSFQDIFDKSNETYNLRYFNEDLETIYKKFFNKDLPDTKIFLKELNNLTKAIKDDKIDFTAKNTVSSSKLYKYFKKEIDNGGSVRDSIEDFLSPNGFKILEYPDLIKHIRPNMFAKTPTNESFEIWSESTCILTRDLDMVKKIYNGEI